MAPRFRIALCQQTQRETHFGAIYLLKPLSVCYNEIKIDCYIFVGGKIVPISYHMIFQKEYTGSLDKYGGLPTHLPAQWPQMDEENLTFLFQLYCDGKKLNIPDTLCIQGYQLIKDGDFLSDIVVVQIPMHAKRNIGNTGLAFYPDGDICFQEVMEQTTYDMDTDFDTWWNTGVPFSKLSGWCDREIIPPGHKFLGWFRDENPFCIGAGYNCCLFLSPDGAVITSHHRP